MHSSQRSIWSQTVSQSECLKVHRRPDRRGVKGSRCTKWELSPPSPHVGGNDTLSRKVAIKLPVHAGATSQNQRSQPHPTHTHTHDECRSGYHLRARDERACSMQGRDDKYIQKLCEWKRSFEGKRRTSM